MTRTITRGGRDKRLRHRRVETEQLFSEVLALLDISLFERNIFFSFSYLRPSETSFPSRETPRRHRGALLHINAYLERRLIQFVVLLRLLPRVF